MARAGGGWRWKILIGQRHAAYRRRGRAEKSQIDPILAHRAKTWPTPDDLNAELALPTKPTLLNRCCHCKQCISQLSAHLSLSLVFQAFALNLGVLDILFDFPFSCQHVIYESFSDVGESWVWLRADFQSGSRVLKKVFWIFSYLYLWHTIRFHAKKHSNFENRWIRYVNLAPDLRNHQ